MRFLKKLSTAYCTACLSLLSGAAVAEGYVGNANILSVSAETAASATFPSTTPASGFNVFVDNPPSGVAACATATTATNRFVADPTTAIGRAQIATILEAKATGRTITIYGLGSCNVWPDVESIERVVTN